MEGSPYGRKSSHQREWLFFVIILPLPTTSWRPREPRFSFVRNSPAEFPQRRLVFMQIVLCNIYASWGVSQKHPLFSLLFQCPPYFCPALFSSLYSRRDTPIISLLIRPKFFARSARDGTNYRILTGIINNISRVMHKDTADLFQRRSDRCRFKICPAL